MSIIKISNTISKERILFKVISYYGPSVISVIVTKEGHPRGSELYKTSGTIKRGVTKSRSYIYTKRTNILTYLYIKRTNVLTYSTITIGRSYIFKYTVPTIR